jgi:hypothetical protein
MTPTEKRKQRAALEQEVTGNYCVRCHSIPRIVWAGMLENRDEHILRCNCYPEKPSMKRQLSYIHRRLGEMINQEVNMETGEIQTPQTAMTPSISTPLEPAQIQRSFRALAVAVENMTEGVHYGEVAGNKTLWEPGAEVLRFAFQIRWDYEVVSEIEDFEQKLFRYRVRAVAKDGLGNVGASWEAQASSEESAFNGMDKAALPNNVLDRAIKRAFVNLMKNCTGASGIFKEASVGDERDQSTKESEAGHPWLVKCPIHGVNWRKQTDKKDPSKSWMSHKSKDGTWCNQSQTLNELVGNLIRQEQERLGWTDDRVKDWIGGKLADMPMQERIEKAEALTREETNG